MKNKSKKYILFFAFFLLIIIFLIPKDRYFLKYVEKIDYILVKDGSNGAEFKIDKRTLSI